MIDDFYTILDQNSTQITVRFSDKRHQLFLAHFPANPIVAGFLQLEIIANILNHKIKKINYIKFLKTIKPLDIVVYHIKTQGHITIFEIKTDGKKTTKAKYEQI